MKEVNYNIKGFIRKNKSNINSYLIDSLKNAKNEIIKTIFSKYEIQDRYEDEN